jgi:hypothetical protein
MRRIVLASALGVLLLSGTAHAEPWRIEVIPPAQDECIQSGSLAQRILAHPDLPDAWHKETVVVSVRVMEKRLIVQTQSKGFYGDVDLVVAPTSCEATPDAVAGTVVRALRTAWGRRAEAMRRIREVSTWRKPSFRRDGFLISASIGVAELDSDEFHASDEVTSGAVDLGVGYSFTSAVSASAHGRVTLADRSPYEMRAYLLYALVRWFPYHKIWFAAGGGAEWFTVRYPFANSYFVDLGPGLAFILAGGAELVTAGPLAMGVSLSHTWTTYVGEGALTTTGFALTFSWY